MTKLFPRNEHTVDRALRVVLGLGGTAEGKRHEGGGCEEFGGLHGVFLLLGRGVPGFSRSELYLGDRALEAEVASVLAGFQQLNRALSVASRVL